MQVHSGRVAAVRLENICENICPEPEGRVHIIVGSGLSVLFPVEV